MEKWGNFMMFKVAVLQMRSVNRAYEENIKTIIEYMTEAKKNNADILLLPECFITGYDLTIDNDSALTKEDLAPLCDTAKEMGIGLVATTLTKGKNSPQNSAFVINKNGEILMKYSKVHTCDFADERVLESGTEFKVCDFEGVRIGVMICYDREYPESARILMLKGAELFLYRMTAKVCVLAFRLYLQERMKICAVLQWQILTVRTQETPVRSVLYVGITTVNVLTIHSYSPMPKQKDCFMLSLIWMQSVHTVSVK